MIEVHEAVRPAKITERAITPQLAKDMLEVALATMKMEAFEAARRLVAVRALGRRRKIVVSYTPIRAQFTQRIIGYQQHTEEHSVWGFLADHTAVVLCDDGELYLHTPSTYHGPENQPLSGLHKLDSAPANDIVHPFSGAEESVIANRAEQYAELFRQAGM